MVSTFKVQRLGIREEAVDTYKRGKLKACLKGHKALQKDKHSSLSTKNNGYQTILQKKSGLSRKDKPRKGGSATVIAT